MGWGVDQMKTLAVLVAAGRGERMGTARPKAFLELGGRPLLVLAARALSAAARVDGIVAVVPATTSRPASGSWPPSRR